MDDFDRALALARAPGLHVDHLRAAAALEDPLRLPGASATMLRARGLPPAVATWLAAPDLQQLATDRQWLQAAGATLILCSSERYPPLLAEIPAAPVALYLRGDAAVLLSAQLAVVGSRSPTSSGQRTARDFALFLARAGLTITSGLAVGIDAAAHAGALAAPGRTIGVLGCGLEQIYPPEHAWRRASWRRAAPW
jgi:DNA processing protein